MSAAPPITRTAVVIGASFAGLLAAAAAAQAGYQVTVLERDQLPPEATPRPGVPQSEQAHVLLHRGLVAIESLLPGVEHELIAHGGLPFNTARMPWLGEHGWMPQTDWSYRIVSLSRPLLELVVRRRVQSLANVTFQEGVRATGLRRSEPGWQVLDHGRSVAAGAVVIDASGRSSRLPHWLADLGVKVPEPTVVEAKLGYASRLYRGTLPISTGAVVAATPVTQTGALIMPVEHSGWIVCAGGYGKRRPGRTAAEFDEFLASLRDPLLAQLASRLEPAGDVAIHRQTANRRFAYGAKPDWPPGLLAVGDALCAFNPVYGQGISVAAAQAAELSSLLARYDGSSRSTRRIQRRISAVADLPWSVATSEDLRQPTSAGERSLGQRLIGRWTTRMIRLAAAGDEDCTRAFAVVYHLMGSPLLLFSPSVVRAVLGSLVRGVGGPAERPAVLDQRAPATSTGSAQDHSAHA